MSEDPARGDTPQPTPSPQGEGVSLARLARSIAKGCAGLRAFLRQAWTHFHHGLLALPDFVRSGAWWPKEWWRRAAVVVVAGVVVLEAADLILAPPLKNLNDVSYVVEDQRGVALRVFPVADGKWRIRADLKRIDPKFVEALLAYEDKNFRSHGGVDLPALGRAATSFISAGHIVSGGSTITMQLARLLEPRPRNIGSKIIESIRAAQLEKRFSKDEILELYLTLAPYGGNLEGVRAASWAYFGREPDNLSPDQIAMLIALPQSPEARRPDLHPKAAVVARERVLKRLAAQSVFQADLAAESAEYPAPTRRDFPSTGWHAAETAIARNGPTSGKTGSREIRTTLDRGLQEELEKLAARSAGEEHEGVQLAIMAIDIETREVRASVGSAHRNGPGGWIDLTTRARSPGSTLKPFIYGLAFDDGIASGSTRIADAPRRFASYRPDNFDRVFRGDVTIAQALQHSLNVPAVAALDQVGSRRFAAALAFAGADLSIPLTAEGDDAGLAIALGGAGLTVRELATLYCALGDGGKALPLLWLQSEAEASRKTPPVPGHVMTEASAKQILTILANAPTPTGRMPARLTQNAPDIAFKTGTSYGYRDAWAAGVGGGYVIIVWSGRADGAPRPGITGREGALPVLFEAFDAIERALPARPRKAASEDPEDIAPPQPMTQFEPANEPPRILFPPDNAEVWSDDEHHAFVLAAEGRGKLNWFADGKPVERNVTGDAVWKPASPGFYQIAVVDEAGRTTKVRVRIKTPRG
jgi:penicillin-binding protein 1C